MRTIVTAFLLFGCLAGCGREETGANVAVPSPMAPAANAPATLVQNGWIGRWTGVEGLVLEIASAATPGTYRLHIATMDGAGDYEGRAEGETIRFTRNGIAETIRRTDGAGTGLKWLAEKKDCLTVQPGEGFCRD